MNGPFHLQSQSFVVPKGSRGVLTCSQQVKISQSTEKSEEIVYPSISNQVTLPPHTRRQRCGQYLGNIKTFQFLNHSL